MDRTRRPGLGLLVPAIRLPADYARVEQFRKLAADGVAGFLLFVLSKITCDLSKANLMPPAFAATLPPMLGGLIGIIALLYQEDG